MNRRRQRPAQKSLLIVRRDTERLHAQGLALNAEPFRTSMLAALGVGARIEMIDGTDRGSLLAKRGELIVRRCPFDSG